MYAKVVLLNIAPPEKALRRRSQSREKSQLAVKRAGRNRKNLRQEAGEIARGRCGERETYVTSLAAPVVCMIAVCGAWFWPCVVKSRIAAEGQDGLAKRLREVGEWNLGRTRGREFAPWLSSRLRMRAKTLGMQGATLLLWSTSEVFLSTRSFCHDKKRSLFMGRGITCIGRCLPHMKPSVT
jgi:hypothetical protein